MALLDALDGLGTKDDYGGDYGLTVDYLDSLGDGGLGDEALGDAGLGGAGLKDAGLRDTGLRDVAVRDVETENGTAGYRASKDLGESGSNNFSLGDSNPG